MSLDWSKKATRIPYLDTDTNRYHIVVDVPLQSAGPGAAALDSLDERENVENIGWSLLTSYFGLDQNVFTWEESESFSQIIDGPVVSPRPGGSTVYLVATVDSQEEIGGFISNRQPPIEEATHTVRFKNYDEFTKKMEILAMMLEEYAENPARGLGKKRPGIHLTGPKKLGYDVYDFKEEAKKVRSFYSELATLFKNNGLTGEEPFEIGFRFPVFQISQSNTNLPADSITAYDVSYVAELTPGDGLLQLNGFEAYFGLDLMNPGSGPDSLKDKRTLSLVANIDSIVDEILSSYPVDMDAVGKGCKLPSAAKEEDVLPPKGFTDKNVRPKPQIGYTVVDPEEAFDEIKKEQPSLVTKEETTVYEVYSTLAQEAVDNRNVNASDYVADAVFDSLPQSPTSVAEIKTVEDVFAYVINRISIDTIIREILICIGLNYSIDDLIDMACDQLLKSVFGDITRLEKLLTFLQSGDSAIALAWNQMGGEETSKLDGMGPTVYQLTDALTNLIELRTAAGALEDTGDPVAQLFAEDMAGSFKGDQKATKRFLCELIIVGPFVGLYALIQMIKNWRDSKDEPKGPPQLPPSKQCDPLFKFPDNIYMFDQIEKHIIDLLRKEAEDFLEEKVTQKITELLYNLYSACRREDENNFGQYSVGDLPLGDDAMPDDIDLCPDLDFDDLMDDLYSSLTPSELCSLYKGTATDDLLNYVLRYFQMKTSGCPSEFSLFNMNTISKIRNYFLNLGKSADLTACAEAELENQAGLRTQQIADLCLIGDSPQEELLARALALRGLTEEQINAQLERRSGMDEAVARSLFDILTAPEQAEAEFGADSSAEIKKSMQQSTTVAVNNIFDPIKSLIASDVHILMPILFSSQYDLIDALTKELDISVTQPDGLKSPGLFIYNTNDLTYAWHGYSLPVNEQMLFDPKTMADLLELPEQIMPDNAQSQIQEEIDLLEKMVDPNTDEWRIFHHDMYTFSPHEGFEETWFRGTRQDYKILMRIFYRWHYFLKLVYEEGGVNVFDGTAKSDGSPINSQKWDSIEGKRVLKQLYDSVFKTVPENMSSQEYFKNLDFFDPGYPYISEKERKHLKSKDEGYDPGALGADTTNFPGSTAWLRWRYNILPEAYMDALGASNATSASKKMKDMSWSSFRDMMDDANVLGMWKLTKTIREYIYDDRPWHKKVGDWFANKTHMFIDGVGMAYNLFTAGHPDPDGGGRLGTPKYERGMFLDKKYYRYGSRFSPNQFWASNYSVPGPKGVRVVGPTTTDITDSPGLWYSFYFLLSFIGFAPEGRFDRTKIILDWYKTGKIPSGVEMSLFDMFSKRTHNFTKEKRGWDQEWRNKIELLYLEQDQTQVTGDHKLEPTGYTVAPQRLAEWTPEEMDGDDIPTSVTSGKKVKELRFKLLPPDDLDWVNDTSKPVKTGHSITLYDSVTQLPIFGFEERNDEGVFYDRDEARSTVNGLIQLDKALGNYAGLKALTLKDEYSDFPNYDLPVEPQLFAKYINGMLTKGYNTVYGTGDSFSFGFPGNEGYVRALREVFFDTDVVQKPLYGQIFRDLIRNTSQEMSRRISVYAEAGAFKDLNFIGSINNLVSLDQEKSEIVNQFTDGAMSGTDEEPGKLLVEYLVDWPAAGAKRSLIKLKTVEACIKSLLTILLIRPEKFFKSKVMIDYLKNLVVSGLEDYQYEGQPIFMNLEEEISDEELTNIILESVNLAMMSIDDALLTAVPAGVRQQTNNLLLDIVAENEPPHYGLGKYPVELLKDAAMATGLEFNFIDIARKSKHCQQRSLGSNKSDHWGLGHIPDNADDDWTHTFFTEPRFTAMDKTQPDHGLYLEKFIWYKMLDEEQLRNIYFYYIADTWPSNKSGVPMLNVFLNQYKDETDEWIEWFIGQRKLFGGYSSGLGVEHIGDPKNLGADVIVCNQDEFQEVWGDFFTKIFTSTNVANLPAMPMSWLKEKLKYLFADFGGGIRLSYVFPENRSDDDPSWWRHPLSAGNNHNFWKEFTNRDLDKPTKARSTNGGKVPAEDFVEMKKQRAYFMREVPITMDKSLSGEQALYSQNQWLGMPGVFVLPLTEIRKSWGKGDDKKAGWGERTYWTHQGTEYSRPPMDWIDKVYKGELSDTKNWFNDRREELEQEPLFKLFSTIIFPIDKIMTTIAMRNTVAFEESIQVMADACLSKTMFPQTEKQLLFLIDWAMGYKRAKETNSVNSSFDYSYQKDELLSQSDIALEKFKQSLSETFSIKEAGCKIREQQISKYITDKQSEEE